MTSYRNRRAATIENDALRVTVLEEGGHIAEIADKATGINPLWTPDWPSIEPSAYDPARTRYTAAAPTRRCSPASWATTSASTSSAGRRRGGRAGLPVHGEVSTARFESSDAGPSLTMRTHCPQAQLRVRAADRSVDRAVRVRERSRICRATDRPIGWTQHVTLGPPFLDGRTELRASARAGEGVRRHVRPGRLSGAGAEFDWPHAPRAAGGTPTCGFPRRVASSAYTAH